MRHAIDGNVLFLHRFEQRRLRLRRGTVDFIDEDDLGKKRPRMENKPLLVAVEDRIANDVRRQQIARKLNPAELQSDRLGQGVSERRLADAGDVLDQQMPARQQAGHREVHGLVLANNDFADFRGDGLNLLLHSDRKLGCGIRLLKWSG